MDSNTNQKIPLRTSDLSTDTEDMIPMHMISKQKFCWNVKIPTTPKSDLFLCPNESPDYPQLNKSLQELYEGLEDEPPIDLEKDLLTVPVLLSVESSSFARRRRTQLRKQVGK